VTAAVEYVCGKSKENGEIGKKKERELRARGRF